jgi:outer membrane protein OmpA-like peptidoglycan-associated protein
MTRRVSVAAATLLLWLSAAAAHADPTPSPVDPATAVTFPVLSFDGAALAITFPQASIDGGVTEDGQVITLRSDVFFAYNKANLNGKAAAAIDRAAAKLKELNATSVRVAGYTDSKGSSAYNRGLSKRRANAVRIALLRRLPTVKYQVRAFGETNPVASNETAKGRSLNRRVTITVLS